MYNVHCTFINYTFDTNTLLAISFNECNVYHSNYIYEREFTIINGKRE